MPKIVGPYGPRSTRRVSTAKVANQREIRHRREPRSDRRRQHKTESCGEQHGAVKDQHHLAVSAESREARRQQQQNAKPDRDQQAHAHSPIDHNAGHRASPIAAEPYKQPRAHPLAGHAGQDLGEEYADSRHGNRGDSGYPRGANCECIENVAPAHAQKRDLKHDDEDRECRPTKIQQWDRGQSLAQIDLPGDVPKTPPGHDQLRCEDRNFFNPATARPTCRLKVAGHADAHSNLL